VIDDDEARFWMEFRLDETARAIALARVRCLSEHELIDEIFDDPELGNFLAIQALKERGSISRQDQAHLFSRLSEALTDDFRRQLTPTARRHSDRLLLHLGGLLRIEEARSLATAQAGHRLVNRHRTALILLRRLGARYEDRDVLRSLVDNYQDRPAARLLAELPGGLAGYTCCDLISNANQGNPAEERDENYYQSAILERMARDGQLDYEHACNVHPDSFLRAIGRLGDPQLVPHLTKIIKMAPADLLPMAASVAGRLREQRVVDLIEQRYNTLRESLQSL
jgi:hypothetical protein